MVVGMWEFKEPQKYISSIGHVEAFQQSETFRYLIAFIEKLSGSVRGFPTDSVRLEEASKPIHLMMALLDTLEGWVAEFPPVENRSMRFGNIAFQKWAERLTQESPRLVKNLLERVQSNPPVRMSPYTPVTKGEEDRRKLLGQGAAPLTGEPLPDTRPTTQPAAKHLLPPPIASTRSALLNEGAQELAAYLRCAFGDKTRLDFGSGHELNFLAFLYGLYRVEFFSLQDFRDVILHVFSRYIGCTRKLQQTYSLEPAGSRGVWGLDDYYFLPFLFGAGQLVGQSEVTPKQATDPMVVSSYADAYLYLDAIRWILKTKAKAPFAECSPLLHDITAVPSWSKVSSGMVKMYQAEVLSKVPVMQHFLFGSLLPPPPSLLPTTGHTGGQGLAGSTSEPTGTAFSLKRENRVPGEAYTVVPSSFATHYPPMR